MKDIKWAGKLLSYRHTLSWFVTLYGSDGINLLRLAAERQSWKVAKAILVSFWHWHHHRALAASPVVVKAMVSLVRFGCRPGRLVDYLYREGNDGANLLIKFTHLADRIPDRFSSRDSLMRHFLKHRDGVSASSPEGYLQIAREAVGDPSAKIFLAYHRVNGRRFPRLCYFKSGKNGKRRLFTAANPGGFFSTCFSARRKSIRAFLHENKNITSVLPLW